MDKLVTMKRPYLLTVDDDPGVLRAVSRDLRRRYGKEYSVLRASSGQEALEALEELSRREEPVALVLSDHRMPEMNGVELLTQIQRLMPDSKRVLLTAYADTEAAIAAINESQLDYYLLKPWDPPEERLYPILDDLLEDWRAGYRPGYGGMRVVATRWSAPAHELRDFLARNLVPYRFLDLERSPEAKDLLGDPAAEMPLVVLEDGRRLEAAGVADVAEAIGLQTRAAESFYDLAIVGAGPAGLASAVYGASEGLQTVLVERDSAGGQAGTSSRIENYLGFPAGLSGSDLARRAVAQVRRFGVEVLSPVEVTGLRLDGPYRHLQMADGNELACHTMMISTGVSWRRLPASGAKELTGRGVYYGASLSEAASCRGETVFIVGAGNSAGQAAMYFAGYAEKVVMVVRGDSLAAKMSSYLVERIEVTENIEVRTSTEVTACHGAERLESLTLKDRGAGIESEEPGHALFVFIGAAPRTEWLEGLVARDRRGFLLTGPDLGPDHLAKWPLEREPFLLETNVPGIFAAGDVRHESVKRVASAVGEGSVAVYFMHRYLASL